MERLVVSDIVEQAIGRLDDLMFVRSLTQLLDAIVFTEASSSALTPFDAINPPYAAIPVATTEQVNAGLPAKIRESAVLTFAAVAALRKHDWQVERVREPLGCTTQNSPLFPVLQALTDSVEATNTRGAKIARLFMTLRIGTPAPIDTLVISIRLLQLAEGSPFNEPLITALQDWTIRAWKRVIDEQRFALTAPAICVPAIRAQLTSGKYGLALLASVLSAAQPAVNIRLDDSLKLLLSRYSMQDACTAES